MEITYHKEERLNALSHAFGALLGIFGFFALWEKAPEGYAQIAVLAYSISFVTLFTASTLYHIVHKKKIKARLRILDHISIYYLIAGTYTPVAMVTLINGNGWLILYVVWGIALAGTLLKLFFTGKFEYLSLMLYLLMGWMIIFDIKSLLSLTSDLGLTLLFLGGACYTLGIFFYAFKRIPYNHLIWHIFVLGGAISHWWYIYLEVLPQ